jgi:competence protein ComEC
LVALIAALSAGLGSIRRLRSTSLVALVACVSAGLGLLAGVVRVRAIDAGAFEGREGDRLAVRGHVVAVPRRTDGVVRIQLETTAGKLLVECYEPVADLDVGDGVRASGTLAVPPPWQRQTLRLQGIARVLRATAVVPTGGGREGLSGRLDTVRARAQAALEVGMPPREAALAQGFVLGQDDRLDAETVDQFRRSGLSHLLAVSGQNVVLLTLLAAPVLAALGLSIKGRLLFLLALIAIYVPLAGAGPSIQRAGVMGAAAVVATIAGRPGSRAFALLAAAAVTLAINPRASGDVGWQLSFAAVVGIFALAGPIRNAALAHMGGGSWSRAAAEGIGVTVAATVATAPLIAHHFDALPVGTLLANLLAMPAVAPAMWLGMIAAAAGQIPGLPLEPVNWPNALLLAYIAQVAVWLGDPDWALLEVRLPDVGSVAAVYLGIVVAAAVVRIGTQSRARRRRGKRRAGFAVAAIVVALLIGIRMPEEGRGVPAAAGLAVDVLDVGQGDAILLRPSDGDPVLVDGGPPGAGLEEELAAAGVTRLAAVIATHDQSDHTAGLLELLGELPADRLVYAAAGRRLVSAARIAGAVPERVWQGAELRSGSLRLLVLWPPRELAPGPVGTEEANPRSLVLLARWRGFRMLLSADAEAEATPLDPGPIDVLKVAHHGSDDAGLAELLDRSRPRLAVISVGDGNPFGHPTASTLATLEGHGVPVLRTDLHGTVSLRAQGGELRVQAGG